MNEGPVRISASAYSNTAPLIWSFLYGSNRGRVEMVLDNAPARSAELLSHDRVDAALVPVIAYQQIEGVRLVPEICVGAAERVQSVCLITKDKDLSQVNSVSLDVSSRTSAALTRIIFREFLGKEPLWRAAEPNIGVMLAESDCALLIGDPSLNVDETKYRKFDIVELWKGFTGLGFVFAMWMTRRSRVPVDLAAARDEGLAHIPEIAANYRSNISLSKKQLVDYLTNSIAYSISSEMQAGLQLYFDLARLHGVIRHSRPLQFVGP